MLFICVNQFDHLRCRHMERKNKMMKRYLQECPLYHRSNDDDDVDDFILRLNEGDPRFEHLKKLIFNRLSRILVSNTDTNTSAEANGEKDLELDGGLDYFTEKEKGAVACGHVFRKGELVYRCKQCGNDDTCVLCAQCFDPDSHIGHDVSYSISGSGGCCDCGDPEAWKNELNCKVHGKTLLGEIKDEEIDLKESKFAALQDHLTEILKECVEFLAETFLDVFYSHKDEVFVPESDITYAVVLYNDEVHNFDQVNDSLVAAISCSTLEAQKIAEIVDRRGRECVVVEKDFARCMTIAEILREHSGINSPFVSFRERSLEVRIAPRLRVCRENMCHFLLQWLIEICKRNELIRKIVSRVFCLPFTVDEERHKLEPKFGKKPKSALEVLLWTDVSLWKEIRCESRELLIISLLVDGTYRKDLALSFSRLYPKISEDFFNLDREPDLNFVFFSVQLFTAPSLALLVIREDDAVLNILKMLNSNFRLCIDQGVELILSVRFITERRYFHALNDLRYFLQSDGVKPILSKSLDLIQAFLDFISIFQGMDKFSREVDAHVEFESESWIYSFNLSMQISLLITHFANLFEDKESLGAAIGQTIMRIKDTNLSFPYFRESPVFPYLNDESSSTAWKQEFEVGQSEVPMSFHHPLHWFLGQLLKRAAKVFNGDFSFLKSIMVEKDGNLDSILLKIMEPGLRIRALIAQTRAGYWVRNGLGLRSQILNYSYNPMVGSLFSKPSDFMRVLVERFSVNQYFFNEISSQTISDDLIPVYGSCLEDFLLLIIALVTNRSNFLPIQDECLEIETEIIQILFLGPCTHSKLDKQLPSRISDSPKFEETLKRVSDFKFPLKIDDQGTYSLKASYIDKIQPYYHHYNPKDRSAVEEKLKQNSKGRNSQTGNTEAPSNLVIPPTILHEPPVLGKNIDKIIVCDTFMRLISVFLGRTSWGGGPSELSTILDNVIDILLYILLMAAQTMETLNVIPEKLILVLESLLAIHKADVKSDHSSSVEFVLLKFHTIIVKMNDEHLKSWYESNLSELVNVSNKALESVKGAEASSSGLNSPMSEMEKKRLAAKAKQSQALAKMMKAQEQAMNQFKDLEKDELFEDEEDENFDEYENGGACVLPKGRCLCCQDPCIPSKHGAKNESVYGVIAFVEPSYLPRYVNMEREAFSKVCHSLVGDTGDSAREPYDPWNGGSEKRRTFSYDRENFNLHVNTCGHIMHFSCKQNYMESVHLNSMSSSYPNHMSLGEFTCPLCGAISNTLIPVFDMEGVVNVMEREEQLLFPCQENPKSSSDSRKWIGDYLQLTSYRDLIISSHAVNGASSNSNNNNNFTRNLAAAESDASDVGREAAVGPAEMTDVSMPGNPEILSGNARASMFTELFVRALNAQRQSSSAFEQSEEDSTQSSAISKTHPFIGSNLVRMIDDFKLLVMSRANRRSFGETLAGLYASLSIEYSNSSSDDYKRSLDYNSDPNYWFRPYFQTNGCSESSLTLQLNPLQKLVLQMSLDSMRMSDLIANLKTFDDELPISRLSSHKLYEDALDSILTNQWSNTLNLKPNLMSSLCQIIVSLHPKTSNLSQIVPSLCRVVFHANVLQMINAVTMLSISNLKKSSRENTESNAVNANGHPLKTFLRLIPKFAACNFDYEKFESLLTNLTIPILREMALITHSILKIPLPRLEYHDENEWSILGTFTGIGESIGQIFSEWIDVFPLMTEFTFSWISNGDNSMGTPLLRIIKSPFPYELIPLPERFETLFFKRDDHPCSKCGQIPSNPSICLVCGDILCSLSICCSENNVGECNQHVQKCCNPGLFLCIQRCAILLLSGDKRLGAFIHAPYLDAYGETDENLRRGHPLALVRDRYEEIRMNWLQGGITTMIFRKNECHLEVQEKDGSLWTSEKVLPWLRYFIFTGIYLSIGDPLIDFAFKAWLPFYWQLKVFCWLFLAYPIGNRRLSNLYKYSSEHILFPLEPTISKLLRRYLPGWITDISSNDISDQNGLSKKSDSSKKNDSSKKSDSSKKNDSSKKSDSIHNTADSIPLVPFTSLKAPNEPIAPIVIRNRKLQNKPRPIILTSSMKQTKRTSSMVDSGEAAKS